MKFTEMIDRVREGIATAMTSPADRVVAALVEEEVERRAGILRRGYDEFKKVTADLGSIKSADARFDGEGNEIAPASFTQQQIQQRKKATDRLEKLDTALGKAHTEGDYSGLEKLLGK